MKTVIKIKVFKCTDYFKKKYFLALFCVFNQNKIASASIIILNQMTVVDQIVTSFASISLCNMGLRFNKQK